MRTIRHPRRKVKLARSLELRESGWATDINLHSLASTWYLKHGS